MFHRLFSLAVATVATVCIAVPTVAAARVHVRVEGKTRTIFGATQPTLEAGDNALTALDAAATAGEFFVHTTTASFGTYVDQIGRYPAIGQTGWVFKVNGVSPPVGADQVRLREGDSVLWYWAQFGVAGGPKTLVLRRAGRCYSALLQDDSGKTAPADGATLTVGSRRTVRTRGGRACIAAHRGLFVRATLPGAVRSNALP